jgi:hypothetical protein
VDSFDSFDKVEECSRYMYVLINASKSTQLMMMVIGCVRRKIIWTLDIVEVRQNHIEGNKNDSYIFLLTAVQYSVSYLTPPVSKELESPGG